MAAMIGKNNKGLAKIDIFLTLYFTAKYAPIKNPGNYPLKPVIIRINPNRKNFIIICHL